MTGTCGNCSREFRQMVYDYSHDIAYGWCRAGEKEDGKNEEDTDPV